MDEECVVRYDFKFPIGRDPDSDFAGTVIHHNAGDPLR